ncbi:MAG: hypothetical protein O7I42_16640 [Alphaproteobacteria bacterium]|nr:hypothetical protein [Alphaproteobacteria bacterium]
MCAKTMANASNVYDFEPHINSGEVLVGIAGLGAIAKAVRASDPLLNHNYSQQAHD